MGGEREVRAAEALKGRAAIETDLKKPKKWLDGDLVNFNKDKCKVLRV